MIVEFSGVGESPFALYQLCEVSPSCRHAALGESGGVSFVNPINNANFNVEGRMVFTVDDKGASNYDWALARVPFDCKPLPATAGAAAVTAAVVTAGGAAAAAVRQHGSIRIRRSVFLLRKHW